MKVIEGGRGRVEQGVVVGNRSAHSGEQHFEPGRLGDGQAADVEVMNDAGDAGQNRVGFEAETGQQGLESDPLADMAERGAVEVETQCLGRTVGGNFQPQEACVRVDEAPDQPGRSQPVYPRAPARGPQPALEVSGVELAMAAVRGVGSSGESRLRMAASRVSSKAAVWAWA